MTELTWGEWRKSGKNRKDVSYPCWNLKAACLPSTNQKHHHLCQLTPS